MAVAYINIDTLEEIAADYIVLRTDLKNSYHLADATLKINALRGEPGGSLRYHT